MSSSVKFKPRMPQTPGTPKATQTIFLADGGIRVEDATVKSEPGKPRPVVFEYHPSKEDRKKRLARRRKPRGKK